jgi:hypothetical protein
VLIRSLTSRNRFLFRLTFLPFPLLELWEGAG